MRSAVLILLTFVTAAAPARVYAKTLISCSSVRTADLQNSNIDDMNFTDGKAYTSEGVPNAKDWEHTLTTDRILNPSPEKELRLIVINSNHLTGSGMWDTVMVFDCAGGMLHKVFEKKYLYGAKLESKSNDELITTSGDWGKDDPNCCPSKKRTEIYRWNLTKNRYFLEDLQ